MQIPFQQFEEYIDETILPRGLSYFENGYVDRPDEIISGLYEAIVKGTADYTVRIQLEGETVTEYSCNCPYDFGPVCKHVVALMFCIREEEPKLQQNRGSKKKTRKKSKKKTVSEQVEELLVDLPHDEMKRFIKEQADIDGSFRRRLLTTFAYFNKSESKAFYAQQVRAVLRTAKGRDGFIDWREVRAVGKAVSDLLVAARKHYENSNYQSVIHISCAVLEEMTKALQFADDSDADIGSNIREAYDLLFDMSRSDPPEKIRKQLFDYALKSYKRNIFSDWDWHLGMLELASVIPANQKEAGRIFDLLDKTTNSEYEREEVQTLKFRLLKKTAGEDEAEKFMEQNLSNPSLRAEAIQMAVSRKNYEKAIAIARGGIDQDSKDKPGLVWDWYKWLLRIAGRQKEKTKIIEYARLLFIELNSGKEHYFDILKTHIDRNKWDSFVEKLVADIRNKRWFNPHVIAWIYVNEGSWEKLLALVKQAFSDGSISLEYVKSYEKYLANDYSDELASLYEQGIIDLLDSNTGRKYYKTACRYLIRMRKLGGWEKAERLIEKLRATYPQRPALLEELERI